MLSLLFCNCDNKRLQEGKILKYTSCVSSLRRVMSILCIASLLAVGCFLPLKKTWAAIGDEDKVTTQYIWQGAAVELDLTFDGTTPGGIPLATSGTKKYENGAFVYGNNGASMGSAWLGKDASVTTISTSTSYTPSNSPKANLFQLKANTTYKLTYKIAYRNDAPENLQVQWMAATDPYLSSGHGRGDFLVSKATMIDGVDVKAPAPAGGTDFGDWQEETIIFTMGGADKYLGFRQNSGIGGQKIFKFDYIKIESGTVTTQYVWEALDNEYVFDYTDASNQAQLTTRMEGLYAGSCANANYSWYNWNNCMVVDYKNATFVNSTTNPGAPGFTAEGMNFHVGKGADIEESADANNTKWGSNALIYDPDIGYCDTNKGYIGLRDNANYIITVKYKITDIQGEFVSLGIGTLKSAVAGASSILPGSLVKHFKKSTTLNEWMYITTTVDTSVATSHADRRLTLTAGVSGDAKWATIIVDSITVKEKRDPQNGVAIIETYNDGVKNIEFATPGVVHTLDVPDNTEEKSFAGWYTSSTFDEATKVDIANFKPEAGTNKLYAKWVNTVCKVTFNVNGVKETKKVAVGEALPRAERPNANLFFEGWYTDIGYTNKITEVPEIGAVELFAKFTGAYLPFNNGGYKNGTGYPELVVDPDDAENKVLKFSVGDRYSYNFRFTTIDDTSAGYFLLETDTTYYYSFKVKVAPESHSANIIFYQGADPRASGERTLLLYAADTTANTTDKNTNWVTFSGSFTTKDTFYLDQVNWAYQNKLFFALYAGSGDTNNNGIIDGDEVARQCTIYLDDFVIYKAHKEAPEGATTIKFETNGTAVSDIYGFPGEKLRLPTPEWGVYKFVGWYTDEELTKPFDETEFGTEDIVLYAGWMHDEFLVDFENYNESSTLSRAKVLNVDGNWLMDYKTEYSSLTDYNTLYRAHVNKNGVCYQVSEGVEYTVSFDYKLTRGTLKYGAVTNGRFNSWTNYQIQKQAGSVSTVTNEWKTITFKFTAKNEDQHKENWNYFSLGLGGDCDAQIDNVRIAKVPDSVVFTQPTQKQLYQYEALDVSGGSLEIFLEGLLPKTIPLELSMVTDFDSSAVGVQQVTICCYGVELTYTVEVLERMVDYISVEPLLDELCYYAGEEFDNSKISVSVHYINGVVETVSDGFEISGFDSSHIGTNRVTVTYMGVSDEIDVDIIPYPVGTFAMSDVEIKAGETFDVYISLKTATNVKMLGINNIMYNSEKLQLLSGEWLAETKGFTSWDINNGRAALIYSQNVLLSGNVFKLTFKAVDGCYIIDESVSCTVIVKYNDELNTDVELATTVEAATVKTIPLKPNDIDGNYHADGDDVIYLLYHSLFGQEEYPVIQNCDFNNDGKVDSNDAVYLMYYNLFGDKYPLYCSTGKEGALL